MTIEKTHNGGYRVSAIVDQQRVSTLYIGYTKQQCKEKFQHEHLLGVTEE